LMIVKRPVRPSPLAKQKKEGVRATGLLPVTDFGVVGRTVVSRETQCELMRSIDVRHPARANPFVNSTVLDQLIVPWSCVEFKQATKSLREGLKLTQVYVVLNAAWQNCVQNVVSSLMGTSSIIN